MKYQQIAMEYDRKITFVAHDNKKRDLLQWAKYNSVLLAHPELFATGTTGTALEGESG